MSTGAESVKFWVTSECCDNGVKISYLKFQSVHKQGIFEPQILNIGRRVILKLYSYNLKDSLIK